MALIILHSSSSPTLPIKKSHLFLHESSHSHPKTSNFSIKSQQDSSSNQPTEQTPPNPKKADNLSSGSGFGSATSTVPSSKRKQQKGRRERASIIRREPLEKPKFVATPQEEAMSEETRKSESAFLLAWLGLGAIILVEGIVLAASGFLPEEWDKFFAKYLYPSFTPTVFLFVAACFASLHGLFSPSVTAKSDMTVAVDVTVKRSRIVSADRFYPLYYWPHVKPHKGTSTTSPLSSPSLLKGFQHSHSNAKPREYYPPK